MLQGFFKLILYFLLFLIIYQIIRFFQAVRKIKKASRPKEKSPGLMVKDEVCNTYLPKKEALK
ncbi:MAG: hypothetical protein ACOC57_06035, partial [Acidobacteriota bacterium]